MRASLVCWFTVTAVITMTAVERVEADPHDPGDSEPFVRELRAGFGAAIAACNAEGTCTFELSALACDADACRADDTIHGRAVAARGAPARAIRDHLVDLGSARFIPGRTAAWSVHCVASPSAPGQPRGGLCKVTLAAGDDALSAQLLAFWQTKLGGNWWTGHVDVHCDAHTCHAACAPGQVFPTVWECAGPSDGASSDFAPTQEFAAGLARRGPGATGDARVTCAGWRDEQMDGGRVDVVGCHVERVTVPPVLHPWSTLVQAGQRWELDGGTGPHLVVETAGVHAVGGAQVARLRWTLDHADVADRAAGRPPVVAVARAGIWFFDDGTDDAAIARAVAHDAPAFADPPPLTAPTASAFAVPWVTTAGTAYCIGSNPARNACSTFTCSAVCYAPGAGVVLVAGPDAPGGAAGASFARAGWTDAP